MNKLCIIGASGHGKVVADVAAAVGYADIVFVDDNPDVKQCGAYSVVGTSGSIDTFANETDFFVAIGNAKIRQAITERLAGKSFATLIHPSAVVSPSASIGRGTVVMPGAVINANAKIGEGCIVNTSASVDHDCVVADFAHISVSAHLAGTVTVGKRTWVGIGAVISNNLTVCEDCTIGAGATVVKSIKEPGTYIGTPAKPINSQTKNTLRGGALLAKVVLPSCNLRRVA